MAIKFNDIICLPVFVFYLEFLKILIGCIPGVQKMIKEFWQNNFVPCMYKFESMQVIYISYC